MGGRPVRIVYTCYGGAHSSPVAAAVHLGMLPRDRVPTGKALLELGFFDKATRSDHGVARLLGADSEGNQVYFLGRGEGGESVIRAVRSGARIAGLAADDILFVDTLVAVNLWMRIGGFISRALGLVRIGRPIVIFGTRRAFYNLVRIVEGVEARLRTQARP